MRGPIIGKLPIVRSNCIKEQGREQSKLKLLLPQVSRPDLKPCQSSLILDLSEQLLTLIPRRNHC